MKDKIQYKFECDSGGDECELIATFNNKQISEISFSYKDSHTIIINHTGVDSQYQGIGLGIELMNRIVAFAREKNFRIIPICSFARTMFDRHTDWNDVRLSYGNEI